jgi:hypothetical protein
MWYTLKLALLQSAMPHLKHTTPLSFHNLCAEQTTHFLTIVPFFFSLGGREPLHEF